MAPEEQAESVVNSWWNSASVWPDTGDGTDRRNLVNLIASAISAAVQDDRNERAADPYLDWLESRMKTTQGGDDMILIEEKVYLGKGIRQAIDEVREAK